MDEISVFEYKNYRDYLRAFAEHKKCNDAHWSYGAWARMLGVQSTTAITMVINGQRHPGEKLIQKLVDYFNFEPNESAYFQNLVHLAKNDDQSHLKSILKKELISIAKRKPLKAMDYKKFEFISNWYFLAIRQLTRLKCFKATPGAIKKALRFEIPEEQVQQALDTMKYLGMVTLNKEGEASASDGVISTGNDIARDAIKIYHQQNLEMASSALTSFKVKEREFTSLTLPIKKSNIPKAKELIRRFIDEFDEIIEDESGDSVYQLNLQFFPVAEAHGEQEKSNV